MVPLPGVRIPDISDENPPLLSGFPTLSFRTDVVFSSGSHLRLQICFCCHLFTPLLFSCRLYIYPDTVYDRSVIISLPCTGGQRHDLRIISHFHTCIIQRRRLRCFKEGCKRRIICELICIAFGSIFYHSNRINLISSHIAIRCINIEGRVFFPETFFVILLQL